MLSFLRSGVKYHKFEVQSFMKVCLKDSTLYKSISLILCIVVFPVSFLGSFVCDMSLLSSVYTGFFHVRNLNEVPLNKKANQCDLVS